MTKFRRLYQIAQELFRLALEYDDKKVMEFAVNLATMADKLEREAGAH